MSERRQALLPSESTDCDFKNETEHRNTSSSFQKISIQSILFDSYELAASSFFDSFQKLIGIAGAHSPSKVITARVPDAILILIQHKIQQAQQQTDEDVVTQYKSNTPSLTVQIGDLVYDLVQNRFDISTGHIVTRMNDSKYKPGSDRFKTVVQTNEIQILKEQVLGLANPFFDLDYNNIDKKLQTLIFITGIPNKMFNRSAAKFGSNYIHDLNDNKMLQTSGSSDSMPARKIPWKPGKTYIVPGPPGSGRFCIGGTGDE